MTTAQNWVERVRTYLNTGLQTERNKLSQSYTSGGNALHVTYPLGGITKGSRLNIGLNTFYVWDVGADGYSATVSGGHEATTDANASSGAVVQVRPRWTDSDIFNALNEELATLSAPQQGLFQMKTKDLTFNAAVDGYDLSSATDLQEIYEVRYSEPGPAKDWPRIPKVNWRLDRDAYPTDFADALALKIYVGGFPGRDVRILYKAPFTLLTDLTTDVSTTGVPTSAYDLPALGAAVRLMSGAEVRRNYTDGQPDSRRAAEVPAGAVFNSYRGLMVLRAQRIADETARLAQQFPAVR